MTTPRQVNRALARAGITLIEIVRDRSGYYWFFDKGTGTDPIQPTVPSIYAHNLGGYTADEIVKHVQKALAENPPRLFATTQGGL